MVSEIPIIPGTIAVRQCEMFIFACNKNASNIFLKTAFLTEINSGSALSGEVI